MDPAVAALVLTGPAEAIRQPLASQDTADRHEPSSPPRSSSRRYHACARTEVLPPVSQGSPPPLPVRSRCRPPCVRPLPPPHRPLRALCPSRPPSCYHRVAQTPSRRPRRRCARISARPIATASPVSEIGEERK